MTPGAFRFHFLSSAPSHMYLAYGCDQNGPPARRSEPDWRREGAYLNGSVTDEQPGRRPIFNATLRAAAGWLFFRVARSLRINLDMLVAPPASPPETLRVNDVGGAARSVAGGSHLEKQPTDRRPYASYI
jgi:hypothetical protein